MNAIVCATCAGSSDMISASVQCATKMPAIPPNAASSSDSVSNCPISRARPAPIDSRTAISLARAAERASSRLAMLAQAISSTSPVTPSSRSSGVFASARTELWPMPPGSTTIGLALNLAMRRVAHALLQRRLDVVEDRAILRVQRLARRLDLDAGPQPREEIGPVAGAIAPRVPARDSSGLSA